MCSRWCRACDMYWLCLFICQTFLFCRQVILYILQINPGSGKKTWEDFIDYSLVNILVYSIKHFSYFTYYIFPISYTLCLVIGKQGLICNMLTKHTLLGTQVKNISSTSHVTATQCLQAREDLLKLKLSSAPILETLHFSEMNFFFSKGGYKN